VDLNFKGTLLSPPWSVGADNGNNTDPDEFEVSCPQRRIYTTPHPWRTHKQNDGLCWLARCRDLSVDLWLIDIFKA